MKKINRRMAMRLGASAALAALGAMIATLPVARNRAAVAAASVFFSIWFLRISRDPGSGPLVTAGNSHRGKCLSISLHINL